MNNNMNPVTSQSQNDAIAKYLKEGGHLTPMDALNLFGCFRLAARIGELRKKGMVIDRKDVPVINSKGRIVYVGDYSLGAGE